MSRRVNSEGSLLGWSRGITQTETVEPVPFRPYGRSNGDPNNVHLWSMASAVVAAASGVVGRGRRRTVDGSGCIGLLGER